VTLLNFQLKDSLICAESWFLNIKYTQKI